MDEYDYDDDVLDDEVGGASEGFDEADAAFLMVKRKPTSVMMMKKLPPAG